MSKPSPRTRSAEKIPLRLTSVTPAISSSRKTRRRRRGTRSPLFAGGNRRRSIPSTPQLPWKFEEEVPHGGEPPHEPGGDILRQPGKMAGVQSHAVSVRRLAAGIWSLWIPQVPVGGKKISDLKINQKFAENQRVNTFYIISALRSELELVNSKVSELESEREISKKKIEFFMSRIQEEKVSWRRKEQAKIRSIIEATKYDLNSERKTCLKLENLNSKLRNELTEAKLSAKKILQEYEKEKKAREIINEVCNEMAKEIGKEKAVVEAMKAESAKNREKVEEERKMMQLAEVWREERVQMKLIDAKITLEEKYSQVSVLEEEIEEFLRSRSGIQYDVSEIRQAELLKDVIESAKNHDLIEFSYQPPPASEGKVQSLKEIEQCPGYPTSTEGVRLERPMKRYDNMIFDGNFGAEDDSLWETVSRAEEQGSSKSPVGSEPSVNGRFVKSRASVCTTDDGDNKKQSSEISEICSVTTGRSRKKGSAMSRLWKSSSANKAGDLKKITLELAHERSPCLLKPRAMNEQGLMGKLIEEGIQSQKVQIRQILREKI